MRADMFQFFESDLFASAGNVVREEPFMEMPDDRGLAGFSILYDSSLKAFQVATISYYVRADTPVDEPDCGCRDGARGDDNDTGSTNVDPPVSIQVNPVYTPFAGSRVRVHSGGPGQNGPVLIDLGTLPPPRLVTIDDLFEPESTGFRTPIRQLTDAEAVILRNAFYGNGFYVQVTDQFSGAPIARAEGELEISVFPTLEPCSFPPCSLRGDPPGVIGQGTVNFATTRENTGGITVYLNGEIVGFLDQPVSADNLPACGSAGDGRTVATENWPETYYWRAVAEDGTTWEGHATIRKDSCETILLE
jgi:hypothetical protein